MMAMSLAVPLLGGSKSSQLLTALFSGTIPQGVLMASGAKNDYTLCFWLTIFLVFALAYWKQPTRWNAGGILLSCTLAVLTKTTAWLILPPLALAAGWIWG